MFNEKSICEPLCITEFNYTLLNEVRMLLTKLVIHLCFEHEYTVFDPSLKLGQRSKNGTFERET